VSEDVEQAAERIAERGREALVARLRPAFEEAAAAHADVLELTPEQLEEMVQKAADRADGLQWRRALASVACEELRIPLSEALGHEAVVRAQELVGAPTYEESLAELAAAARAAEGAGAGGAPEAGESAVGDEPEAAPAGLAEDAQEEEPAPTARYELDELGQEQEPYEEEELEEEEFEAEALEEEEPEAEEFEAEELEEEEQPYEEEERGGELRISVVHIGGIANLAPAEPGIELKLAEPGLDIVRSEGEVLGRLEWDQVRALEVPPPRRRLRRGAATHLVIRTARGDASFEVPGISADELREQLSPILELYLPGGD
jgi:hypothetical protein